jgi:hypothetical protein
VSRPGPLVALLLAAILGVGLWAASVFRVKTAEGTLAIQQRKCFWASCSARRHLSTGSRVALMAGDW